MIHHANAESTAATVRGAVGSAPRALRRRAAHRISHQLPKRDSEACLASDSPFRARATARQGGDSPDGLFPGPSSSGVFPDPKAGAAANFATPAVRVPFRGTRARKEQRGRPISSLRGFPTLRPGSPALPLSFFASIGTGGGVRRFVVPSSRPMAPAPGAAPAEQAHTPAGTPSPSPRVPVASGGPSLARTQAADFGRPKGKTEDAAARSSVGSAGGQGVPGRSGAGSLTPSPKTVPVQGPMSRVLSASGSGQGPRYHENRGESE